MASKDDKKIKDSRLGGKRQGIKLPSTKGEKKSSAANMAFNIFILAFIVYGFYSYMQKGGDVGVFNELGAQLEVIDAPREGDPRIDRLQEQQRVSALTNFFPVERPNVSFRSLQEGNGVPVSCGQTVSYRLISGAGSQQKISDVQSLRLGDVKKPHGLTLGIEGMRAGEIREITIPQQLWTGSDPRQGQKASVEVIKVELQSFTPPEPQASMPLRRYVTSSASGAPLRCGDLAMVHLSIWAQNGQELFSTKKNKPVYFYIGENTVPYALERGVHGMLPGGRYSLVFAPELWKRLTQEGAATPAPDYKVQPFPNDIAWPTDQLILVDVGYPKQVPRTQESQKQLPQKPIAATPVPELTTELSEPSEVVEPTLPTSVKE